ncbi:membrane protein [Defluviimonas sp. 20V17]|uniref:Membrane protein n=1 Tax=Allgaiera indica TaxID=765699 RepID=A0AAN4UT93_9RHOB|nr:efflux RND transporter periplasmic adaptor subunit [Allgaiera indica]KDB05365.1 membrane protein [Defluviimonas sp. 20V17]GHE04171.1 membrane protein [Allgaiera indica]SDX50354.1 RND family efflux transporter, MFP subunit [Allgaiera indica]
MRHLLFAIALAAAPWGAQAGVLEPLKPVTVTDWKAVYGEIEPRDQVPARARIGGTLVSLKVTEGNMVTAGQEIGEIVDRKIAFQLNSYDAQLQALQAQLSNAETELKRGEELLSRGVSTTQRLDALRTQVDVLKNQIASTQAQRQVVVQQANEGKVLAPIAGRVLTVPVAKGSVIMPGEAVATVAGGGFFLRLAVPERHATFLKEGAPIRIETPDGPATGTLAKVYPLIQGGRVTADVEVKDLPDRFVNARVLVRLPVGERQALVVPAGALITRLGLDYVKVREDGDTVLRTVVPGSHEEIGGQDMVEILSGLAPGDRVVDAK